ncbi:MAG: alpha/beta hydrolase-fold protein [Nocardioides sp.]
MRALTRRTLLSLGGASALVGATAASIEHDLLPGRVQLHETLGLNGTPGAFPTTEPGRVDYGSFRSQARGGLETGFAIAYPPGGQTKSLPVVVALHMLKRSHRELFGPKMVLDQFLAEAVARGAPAFAIAAPDGGNTYWHRRPWGEDAGAMVVDEFLPMLARRGLDTSRIGLLGWSMGGYGALRLGGLLGPERVAAISVAAPAIWSDPDEFSPSGFATAEEYAEFTVFGQQRRLRGIPVRIDCGEGDPFYRSVQAYAEELRAVGGARKVAEFQPGAHEPGFWRRVLPSQLDFLSGYLAAPITN